MVLHPKMPSNIRIRNMAAHDIYATQFGRNLSEKEFYVSHTQYTHFACLMQISQIN